MFVPPIQKSKVASSKQVAAPPAQSVVMDSATRHVGPPTKHAGPATTLSGLTIAPPPATQLPQPHQPAVATGTHPPQSQHPFVVDAGLMIAARDARGTSASKRQQVLRPLFHVTSSDVVISAIECEPTSGLMAFSLSNGDVYVSRAPTGDSGSHSDGSGSGGEPDDFQPTLVGKMAAAPTQLLWAAPQSAGGLRAVLHLVCCSPGRAVKVFSNNRFTSSGNAAAPPSASGWSEEAVEVQDCIAVAWSTQSNSTASVLSASPAAVFQHELSLICVCGKLKIACCQRRNDGYGAWVEMSSYAVGGAGKTVGEADASKRAASASAAASNTPSREFSCIDVSSDCISGHNMVAVGDQEGWIRVFEAPIGGGRQGVGSERGAVAGGLPQFVLQVNHNTILTSGTPTGQSHQQQGGNFPSVVDGIRHVAWGCAQGRSFVPLAYVAGSCDLVVLLVANTLSNLLDTAVPVGTVLGYRRVHMREEVLKASWNSQGTRLTTSHCDGTVRVHSLSATFRDARRRAGSIAPGADSSHPHCTGDDRDAAGPVITIMEKYTVGLEEISRSVAPYTADPLAT